MDSSVRTAIKALNLPNDDQELLGLANDVYMPIKSAVGPKEASSFPYACLEVAYVILGRPIEGRPAFQVKSGASLKLYTTLLSKITALLGNYKNLPKRINTVETACKAVSLESIQKWVNQLLEEHCRGRSIRPDESEILPVACLLVTLSASKELFGSRSSRFKMEEMAVGFLLKRPVLNNCYTDILQTCSSTIEAFKSDKALQRILNEASKTTAAKPSKRLATVAQEEGDFDLIINPFEIENKRQNCGNNTDKKSPTDLLFGYGDTWGPRGLVPLLPFERTEACRKLHAILLQNGDLSMLQSFERLLNNGADNKQT